MDYHRGAGDGNKRIPVPSSRKFTPNPPKNNENIKLKLHREISALDKCLRLEKSKSVAEITPTKTRQKRAKQPVTPILLHGTPRPFIDEPTPSRRNNQEVKAAWLIYRRMILHAWRRNRARLTTLRESSRRHQEQMNQLEIQVDVLKDLRKSETEKCQEIVGELNRTKIILDESQKENISLSKRNEELKIELYRMSIEVESQKTEIAKKILTIEHLEDDMNSKEEELKKSEEKKGLLHAKLKKQHSIIKLQQKALRNFETSLADAKTSNKTLQAEMQSERDSWSEKYNDIIRKYEATLNEVESLKNQINTLQEVKEKLNEEKNQLNIQLNNALKDLENTTSENINLKNILLSIEERKEELWNNAKNILFVTLTIFRHNIYLMLPALPPF